MKLNSQISFLQTFGILLVVVGHSFYQHETNVIYRWILYISYATFYVYIRLPFKEWNRKTLYLACRI